MAARARVARAPMGWRAQRVYAWVFQKMAWGTAGARAAIGIRTNHDSVRSGL